MSLSLSEQHLYMYIYLSVCVSFRDGCAFLHPSVSPLCISTSASPLCICVSPPPPVCPPLLIITQSPKSQLQAKDRKVELRSSCSYCSLFVTHAPVTGKTKPRAPAMSREILYYRCTSLSSKIQIKYLDQNRTLNSLSDTTHHNQQLMMALGLLEN